MSSTLAWTDSPEQPENIASGLAIGITPATLTAWSFVRSER